MTEGFKWNASSLGSVYFSCHELVLRTGYVIMDKQSLTTHHSGWAFSIAWVYFHVYLYQKILEGC